MSHVTVVEFLLDIAIEVLFSIIQNNLSINH